MQLYRVVLQVDIEDAARLAIHQGEFATAVLRCRIRVAKQLETGVALRLGDRHTPAALREVRGKLLDAIGGAEGFEFLQSGEHMLL